MIYSHEANPKAMIFVWVKQVREAYPGDFKHFDLKKSRHGVKARVVVPVSATGRRLVQQFVSSHPDLFPGVSPQWASNHPEWVVPYLKD